MEIFADLTFWQMIGILFLVIPVSAAVIFVVGWIAVMAFIIVFKIAVLAVIFALLFAFIYLAQGGTF
jgi:hypothetical protein